jgi:hypothetical protein
LIHISAPIQGKWENNLNIHDDDDDDDGIIDEVSSQI